MAQDVKRTRRRYVSPKRQEQARRTRRDIVVAARGLLVERGYATTTIEAIAADAGVAVQTIYSAVGNKRAVLWAVLETAVAGDDAPDTVLDRFRAAVGGAPDARTRLQRAVAFGRQVMERSADVQRIMRSAADSDPEVAAALDEAERRRFRDSMAIVEAIAGDDGFREGIDRRTAADLLFAATSYEMYELLIQRRRWSAGRYSEGVTRVLDQLLPGSPARSE